MAKEKQLSVKKDFQIVDVFPSGKEPWSAGEKSMYDAVQREVSIAKYCLVAKTVSGITKRLRQSTVKKAFKKGTLSQSMAHTVQNPKMTRARSGNR